MKVSEIYESYVSFNIYIYIYIYIYVYILWKVEKIVTICINSIKY